jgi:hypothetical protein
MRPFTKILLPALAALVVAAAPAAAQVGVLDQPFRNDPFQPLLEGRWSFTHYLNVGADNNTLGVGDMVAIGYLASDFRPSDIFLIAGLVPVDEGVRVGSQNRTAATLTFPAGRLLTFGITGGVRAIAEGQVPDDVAALVREGMVGDVVTVDLTHLGGEAFVFAEGGLHGLFKLPLVPTPMGDLTLLAGVGGRYIQAISHSRVGFAGDEGDAISTFTLTRQGVTTELNIASPLAEDVLAEGGSGFAFDLMAGAAIGHRAQLRLALTDLGSAQVNVGRRAVTTIIMEDVSFVDMSSTADSLATTDTLAAVTRDVALPTTVRVDGTFRPLNAIGLGFRIAAPVGDGPSLEPLAQAGLELRPFRVLPLRAGILGGGDFGTGFFGGFGIDARTLRFDLEVASSGGPAISEMRGVSLRTGLALRF